MWYHVLLVVGNSRSNITRPVWIAITGSLCSTTSIELKHGVLDFKFDVSNCLWKMNLYSNAYSHDTHSLNLCETYMMSKHCWRNTHVVGALIKILITCFARYGILLFFSAWKSRCVVYDENWSWWSEYERRTFSEMVFRLRMIFMIWNKFWKLVF